LELLGANLQVIDDLGVLEEWHLSKLKCCIGARCVLNFELKDVIDAVEDKVHRLFLNDVAHVEALQLPE
jgi:hypothetical protein